MPFNRNGYVLNFPTNDLDVFTTNSIGEPLSEKFGLSKGKSLIICFMHIVQQISDVLISSIFTNSFICYLTKGL